MGVGIETAELADRKALFGRSVKPDGRESDKKGKAESFHRLTAAPETPGV
jgi:hypothetical protein